MSKPRTPAAGRRQGDQPRSQMELLLLAMYLDAEDQAATGLESCTYPGGVFDDGIWRAGHPRYFKLMRRVRRALGLKPFRYRDARQFGAAYDRLAEFRAKERDMVRGLQ